jgi:hypothetical protein
VGIGAAGAGVLVAVAVLVPGVEVVPAVAVGVPLGEEVVAAPVTVAGVVESAFGVCGEDPQAAASSSTPTVKVMALAPRTAVSILAHILRHRSPSVTLTERYWARSLEPTGTDA